VHLRATDVCVIEIMKDDNKIHDRLIKMQDGHEVRRFKIGSCFGKGIQNCVHRWPFVTFRNKLIFYGKELLALRPT
jgi:hypothetical protein